MLEVASVCEEDTVYDMGSGNGAVVITAARDFGAKCVGIELRKDLANRSMDEVRKQGIDGRVKILNLNFFDVDISDADVVTLYLTSSGNLKLKPKLEKELKDNARVVSHDFEINGWTPSKILKEPPGHTIYFYVKTANRKA